MLPGKARCKPFRAGTFGFEKSEDPGIKPVDLGSVVFLEIADFEAHRHKIVLRPAVKGEVRLLQKPDGGVTPVKLMSRVPDDGQARLADELVHARLGFSRIGQEDRLTAASFHPIIKPF